VEAGLTTLRIEGQTFGCPWGFSNCQTTPGPILGSRSFTLSVISAIQTSNTRKFPGIRILPWLKN